ncbi:hypothetical protein [Kordiimonas gwangyangensis]|uniref:hypothetical protein n=1 Tax=Kordiimonas gwangyangensis TaxID=288022 RepID=UPI0003645916|nr:hypothetical protein [Kordiimonas gwangyangensis]
MNTSLSRAGLLTAVGAILAIVGLFSPMLDIGGMGTVAYADVAETDAYIIAALAAIAVIVLFLGKTKLALPAALGAWIVLLWPILKNMGGEDEGIMGSVKDMVSNPAQKMAEEVTEKLFTNVLDLEWGGFAFLIGMLLMLISSVVVFGRR